MFANLKNKLIEEVKASPSKFQQFANAAQAAVSSSSSSTPNSSDTNTNTSATNENFFSITEEDTPQNSPYRIQKLPATSASSLRGRSSTQSLNSLGAVPRTRKLSNSSMASDVSFRLPTYDAPSVYHLQSDLDETSSEFDDSASTARLDVITKDQLYDAYKKSLDRYHKYRCRYTDLAKKYKELERDSSKARSVLVETQDKALRRISELREQCTLEQQAKAHLEEALRIEMDDMSCKMQAYQTKLKLLGENPDNIAAALERSGENEKLIDLAAVCANGGQNEDETGSELQQLRQQLEQVTEKYEAVRKQEEENVLLLAQTKQAIHTELEHKDNELRRLQEKLQQLESERDVQKDQVKGQLKKLQSAKQEADAKVIASEHLLSTMKERLDTLEQQVLDREKSLEIEKENLAALTSEKSSQEEQYKLKLQQFQMEIQLLNEQHACSESETIINLKSQLELLNSNQHDIVAKEKDLKCNVAKLNKLKKQQEQHQAKITEQAATIEQLQLQSQEKENEKENLQAHVSSILAEITTMQTHLKQVQNSHRELEQEKQQLESHIDDLQQKQKDNSTKTAKMEEIQSENTKLAERNCLLQEQTNHLKKQLEEQSEFRLQVQAKEEELSKLQLKMQQVLDEHSKLQNAQELMDHDYRTLQDKCDAYEKENSIAKDELESQRGLIVELQQIKASLEQEFDEIQQNLLDVQERHQEQIEQSRELKEALENLRQENVEAKEAVLLAKEQNGAELQATINELRQKLDGSKKTHDQNIENESKLQLTIQNLREQLDTLREAEKSVQEKIQATNTAHSSQLDTLQKKCDAYEKETLKAQHELESQRVVSVELEQIKANLEHELDKSQQKFLELNERHQQQIDQSRELTEALENLRQENVKAKEAAVLAKEQNGAELEATIQDLRQKLDESKKLLNQNLENESRLHVTIQNLREQLDTLREAEKSVQEKIQVTNAAHSSQLDTLQKKCDAYEKETLKAQHELESQRVVSVELEQNKANLEHELDKSQQKFLELNERHQQQIDQSRELTEALENLRQENVETKGTILAKEQNGAEFEAIIHDLRQKLDESKKSLDQNLENESQLHVTIQNLREQLDTLREAEKSVQEKIQATNASHSSQLVTLEARWSAANGDVERLHEANDALQLEIDQLKNKHNMEIEELQKELSERNYKVDNQAQISEKLARFEEAQIENEYLNKHTKQLEQELAEHVTIKEKLKSLQCELYVLHDKVEEHANQLTDKDKQNEAAKMEIKQLKSALEEQTLECSRQQEHASFVTEQSDTVQKEMLHTQQQLTENQAELLKAHEEQQRLQAVIENISTKMTLLKQESSLSTAPALNQDADILRSINEELQRELEELKYKSQSIESNLQQEVDELQSNNKQMAERINELETLRAGIQAQQLMASLAPKTIKQSVAADEKAELEAKLKEIMNEVQDVTNRNLFLEQKCENFLILEQSNERLKLQNAKLSRQLDETLVSMQHSENGVPANTEFEYLKNIMFQYLTGNTNNETLVKVISAVLKFSPQQAQVALEKEHQRRSLLNKLI